MFVSFWHNRNFSYANKSRDKEEEIKKIINNKTCLVFTVVAVVLFVLVNISWWASANADENLLSGNNENELNWVDANAMDDDAYCFDFDSDFFRLDKDSLWSKTGFSCYQHNTGFRFYDKWSKQMSIYDVGLVWNEDTNKLQVSYKTQSDGNNESKVFRFNIRGNYKDKNTGIVKKFYVNSSDEDGLLSDGEEEVPFLCGFLISDRSRLVDAGSLCGSWYLDKGDDFEVEDHCTFDFDNKIKEGSKQMRLKKKLWLPFLTMNYKRYMHKKDWIKFYTLKRT